MVLEICKSFAMEYKSNKESRLRKELAFNCLKFVNVALGAFVLLSSKYFVLLVNVAGFTVPSTAQPTNGNVAIKHIITTRITTKVFFHIYLSSLRKFKILK